MTEYKIVIEQTAENDLLGILSYISDTLHELSIAMKIYGLIKKEILNLNRMPFRFEVVNEEPYRSMGVRRIPVENYTAFYIVDENEKTVHIFRIIYNRREWRYLL
ncbi:MAG: type II toxin-antitoxin system RelE/ParE family toxin [Acutalibacteraceae bacterium]|nr:type II toxin-antitoxin system RelE/ParE family toxin [Acutalibacteraceae bacterium]